MFHPPLRVLLGWILLLPLPAAAQAPAVVGTVSFQGRVRVQESALREATKLRPGGEFSAERLEADRRALMALGYFRSVGAAQRTTSGRTDITFRLVEWPRVAHVRILGQTVVERRAIQEVISTQLGQVLCAPQLQDDIRAIEQLYRERGYVARVSESILAEATRSGILRFEILELRIAEVRVEGGTPPLVQRCLRSLVQVVGELYQPEQVSRDQRRLLRIRGVRDAVPQVEVVSPGRVRVRWLLNPPESTREQAPG